MTIESSFEPLPELIEPAPERPRRIMSVDALRGLVMFTMIFVNDIAGVSKKIVPEYWMRHYTDNKGFKNGMTYVDAVFPAFLFIVGMSIPFALGSRLLKGERMWKIVLHVLTRTAALLMIGIMMVNSESGPDSATMGWSRPAWTLLMYICAILAFAYWAPPRRSVMPVEPRWRTIDIVFLCLRILGFIGLLVLALLYRGKNGSRLLVLWPPSQFHIRTSWYGILGLIGWAYLVGSIVFLIFRINRTALLGCMVLLLCFYAADNPLQGKKSTFSSDFRIDNWLEIGQTFNWQMGLAIAGYAILALLLLINRRAPGARMRFIFLAILGGAMGGVQLFRHFAFNRASFVFAWIFAVMAIAAAVWLFFDLIEFRNPRIAFLGTVGLLLCLYPLTRTQTFGKFEVNNYVGIGETLGSQAAITVGGLLLASILISPDMSDVWARNKFTLLFIAGCCVGAMLLHRLYGVDKNNATPSWCLWACAITATVWLIFYFICDVLPGPVRWLGLPWAIAGQNVLLAYLISEMLGGLLNVLNLGEWYGRLAEKDEAHAIARSAGCAAVILLFTAIVNRIGFRLKL